MEELDHSQSALSTAGARLRAAREAQGLSRTDIAALTRVAERHLAAIEEDRLTDLAAPTYAVGFSRAYARAVGLPEVEITTQVRQQLKEQPQSRPITMPSFEPGDPARVPPSRIAWLAGSVAVLLIGFMLIYWNSFLSPEGELPSLVTDPTPTARQTAAPASPATSPATAVTGPVVLTAMAPKVWVKVTDASGNQLFQKEMSQGESYTVPADASGPQLRTGRPDELQITVGGRAIPRLGDKPEVISGVALSPAALLERARGSAALAPSQSGAGGAPTAPASAPAPQGTVSTAAQ